jgi:Spy/CpxP family protein refolding chaperone
MRRIWVLTIAACVLGGLAAIGQNLIAGQDAGQAPPAPQQAQPRNRVDRELQTMTQNLNLTDDQQAKIRPLLQDQAKQLRELRADSTIPEADARAKAREIRQSTRKQIVQILTPEQREKFKEVRQERRSGQQAPPPQPTQPPPSQ